MPVSGLVRRLKIGQRLTVAFAVVLVLLFAGGAVALWQMGVTNVYVERVQLLDGATVSILRVHNSVLVIKDELAHAAAGEDAGPFVEQAAALRGRFVQDVDAAIGAMRDSPVQSEEQGRVLAELEGIRASMPAQIDSMVDLAGAGDWLAVRLRLDNQVQQTGQITQNLVEEINAQVAVELAEAEEALARGRTQAIALILGTGALVVVIATLLGVAVTRSIARPLARLDAGAQALARGEFTYQVRVEGEDELGHLAEAFNDAADQLAELYAGLEQKVLQRTEQFQRRALQLETSMAVGRRVISILDRDALLHQVAALIRERYLYDYVGIFLPDETGSALTAYAGAGKAGEELVRAGYRVPIGPDTAVGWVAQNRQALYLQDVAGSAGPVDARGGRFGDAGGVPGTRSELALPLKMGDTLLGVLDIRSERAGDFEQAEIPVFQSLADQVAIAIQNAALYAGERSRRRLAENLATVGRALTGTLDPAEVFDRILEYLQALVAYDRAAVMLRRGSAIEMVAVRGFPEHAHPLDAQVPIEGETEDGIFAEICRTQRPLVLADASQRPDWQEIEGVPDARAWMGVPLIRHDEVIGMLSATRETPQAYDDEDVAVATTFAAQAAIALENARLYEEIRRFSQELESLVAERTEALRVAYEQLERMDRAKSKFVEVASHELRTPLTVLYGYTQILLRDSDFQGTRHEKLVSGIYSGAVRMQEIVNAMLDMAKIDSRALELYHEPVTMSWVLRPLCDQFARSLSERELELELGNLSHLPPVEADPEALRKVFHHLISNAIKYTPDGGRISITGEWTFSHEGYPDGAVEIVVGDTGIGIDPDAQELIFAKFYQTGEVALHSSGNIKFKGGGPGLGLAIARGIAEAHGGKLWVESAGCDEERCPGSAFHVVLPVRQG